MRRLWIGLIVTLSLNTSFATSFYDRPFPEYVKDAPYMVRGKIGKSSADFVTLPDGTKQVFTFFNFQVDEVLKGKMKPGPIKIRELGGEKDGVGMQISGTAEFAAGEDVVVFLDEKGASTSDDAYPLQGMMMGKFNIEKGPNGKEYLRGAAIGASIQPALRNRDVHDHSGPKTQWSLDDVRELIKKQGSELTVTSDQSPTPTSTGDGLLKGTPRSSSSEMKQTDSSSHAEGNSSTRRSPSGWVIALGIFTGAFFYWRSKKRS